MMIWAGFCRASTNQFNEQDVIGNYNLYLKAVKLDTLIIAKDMSFAKKYRQNGKFGMVELNNVDILTLEPNGSFSNPLRFINAWQVLLKGFNDPSTVYSHLFSQLAAQTALKPESLCIRIGDDSSGAYSYLIYFNNGVKTNQPTMVVRAGNDDLNYNPADLDNSLCGGFLPDQRYSASLKDDIKNRIYRFLKGNPSDDVHVLPPKSFGSNTVSFVAYGLHKRITDKFNEAVTIVFFIIPRLPTAGKIAGNEPLRADIGFNFNVVYSGDPINTENYGQFKNAINCCSSSISAFGAKIKGIIQDAVDHEH